MALEGDVTFSVTVENATAAGLMAARADINRATAQIQADMTKSYGGINATVKSVEESFRRLGNTLVGAGGALMGTFTLPIVLGFRQIITEGQELETEIYRVTSIFKGAGDSIEDTKSQIEGFAFAAATSSQYTALEVLKAMYAMGQAGYQLADIYKILPSVMNLATAQQYDLLESFNLVNAASKSYTMSADETIRFTEMAADAATRYNLTLEQLQQGMKYFAPITATLNMSMEQMLVAFGLLTERGFSGMQAGRILRDSIGDLVAPTLESKKIIEEHSLALYTNQAEMSSVSYAYQAAQKRLEIMKDAHVGSKEEIERLNESLITNRSLLEKAQMAGDASGIAHYKGAIVDLINSISDLTNATAYDSDAIDIQNRKVEALGEVYRKTGATGLLPMSELLKTLAEANMTEAEYFELFGKQSAGAMISLVEEYKKAPAAFTETANAIAVSNTATQQAEVQMQSTAYQLKQLKNVITGLVYEGYKALAPVIREINRFFVENKDALVKLGGEIISSFVPALQNIFAMIKKVMDIFIGMNPETRKMIFNIAATTAIFLAAAGPVLLYTGAIAWAAASFMKLGRGAYDVITIVSSLTRVLSLSTPTIFATNEAIFGTAKMMEAVGATGVMVNPSIVATGSAMGAVESGAIGASGALAGVGATLITLLPYIAAVALVGYGLYFAWKNNIFGIRDATDEMAKDVALSLMKLKDDVYEITDSLSTLGEGIGDAISGGIEANTPKMEFAMWEIIGSIARTVTESIDFIYKLGVNMRRALYEGIINGSFDISRAIFRDFAETQGGGAGSWETSEAYKGLIKGYYGGMKEIDEATGKLVDSKKAQARELAEIDANLKQYGFTPYSPDYINSLRNATKEQEKVAETKKDLTIQEKLLAGQLKASEYLGSYTNKTKASTPSGNIEIPKGFIVPVGVDLTSVKEDSAAVAEEMKAGVGEILPEGIVSMLFGEDSNEKFKELGSSLGTNFGDTFDEETKKYIEDTMKYLESQAEETTPMINYGSNIEDINNKAKMLTSKDINPYTTTKVGDKWFNISDIQALVSSWRGNIDEMPNLVDMVKDITPVGNVAYGASEGYKEGTTVNVASPGVTVDTGYMGLNSETLYSIKSILEIINANILTCCNSILSALSMNKSAGTTATPSAGIPSGVPYSPSSKVSEVLSIPTTKQETAVPKAPYIYTPPVTNNTMMNVANTFNIFPKEALTDGEIEVMTTKISIAVDKKLGAKIGGY